MGNTDSTSFSVKRVVYACSGCADVGEVADKVSRQLRKDGFASPKASCLAGIGAGMASFIHAAKAADEIVTIDGCEVFCARTIMENVSLQPKAYALTQMGCEKGNTPCTPEIIHQLAAEIAGS